LRAFKCTKSLGRLDSAPNPAGIRGAPRERDGERGEGEGIGTCCMGSRGDRRPCQSPFPNPSPSPNPSPQTHPIPKPIPLQNPSPPNQSLPNHSPLLPCPLPPPLPLTSSPTLPLFYLSFFPPHFLLPLSLFPLPLTGSTPLI